MGVIILLLSKFDLPIEDTEKWFNEYFVVTIQCLTIAIVFELIYNYNFPTKVVYMSKKTLSSKMT